LSEYICETCGKSYKTRSGLWKHQKAKGHGKFAEGSIETQVIPVEESQSVVVAEQPTPQDTAQSTSVPNQAEAATDTPSWMDFDFSKPDDATDSIPATFKSILKPVPAGSGKMSKAQAAALEGQNKGILKMGLTTIDVLLSKYGQAVSLDPDFTVQHSESDKELVANAQYRWMEEKGFFLTNYISTGMIASGLTLHYVAAPVYRIRRKAKRRLFKGRGLLSRLPLIGRLFRRKQVEHEIGQTIEVESDER
jgi:hypothetical protein